MCHDARVEPAIESIIESGAESPAVPAADILVVDDTPANLRLLAEILRADGHTVRPVRSGARAIQAARLRKPDVMLIDITMPEMNGYELCTVLKQDQTLESIPIIFVSGRIDSIDKVRAFESGGIDYITKPIDAAEVRARVGTHVRLSRCRAQIASQATQLEESLTRLRELESLRDDLTHMLVHDLRAPICAIVAFAELIRRDGNLNAQTLDDFSNLEMSAARLARLVDDILDVSRLEASRFPVKLAEHDCIRVVEGVLASLAAGRRVELVRREGATHVTTDADILARVILNLLDNALKLTPPTEKVRVLIEPSDDIVRIGIEDHGPGIAPEEQAEIFEKFRSSGDQGGRRASGLGLTFCKMAMDVLDGTIVIDSEQGRGSTFWLEHPR